MEVFNLIVSGNYLNIEGNEGSYHRRSRHLVEVRTTSTQSTKFEFWDRYSCFLRADITQLKNSKGAHFDISTLFNFLDEFTGSGFNTASGGSEAKELKCAVYSDITTPYLGEVSKDDYGNSSVIRISEGYYVVNCAGVNFNSFVLATPQNSQVRCDVFVNDTNEIGIEFFNIGTGLATDINGTAFLYVSTE